MGRLVNFITFLHLFFIGRRKNIFEDFLGVLQGDWILRVLILIILGRGFGGWERHCGEWFWSVKVTC